MESFKTYTIVCLPRDQREPVVGEIGRMRRLPVPLKELRFGTLDNLLQLSDELSRLDSSCSAIMSKVARMAAELRNQESLPPVEVRPGSSVDAETYIMDFEWSDSFPVRNKLAAMVQQIVKSMAEVDDGLRMEASEAANVRNELATIVRKDTGSLQSRSLFDVIKSDDVVDTEYLKTVFVFVQSHQKRVFLDTYAQLGSQQVAIRGQMVNMAAAVPNSVKEIATDGEGVLYRVVVLEKMADEFKRACREGENRFTVREFEYTEGAAEENAQRRQRLEQEQQRIVTEMKEHTAGFFSQAFVNWVHLKIIRVVVESILRYGLPPTFSAFVIKADKKNEKKIKQMLVKQYEHLGSVGFTDKDVEAASTEFLPFVVQTLMF